MGCSQNSGPLLVIDYMTAPNISEYPVGTLISGTTHVLGLVLSSCRRLEIPSWSDVVLRLCRRGQLERIAKLLTSQGYFCLGKWCQIVLVAADSGARLISEVGLDISLSFRYAMPSARVHVRSTCSRPVSVLRTLSFRFSCTPSSGPLSQEAKTFKTAPLHEDAADAT